MSATANKNGSQWQRRRQVLVEELRHDGITDRRVLAAIESIPREMFVPDSLKSSAYENIALPVGHGQTISQPYIVGLMSQALELSGNEVVLDVGTGSGYQAAVLAKLCRHVVTIERIPELARMAEETLTDLGIDNVTFLIGDGTHGAAEYAPYDGILVAATAEKVPPALVAQLKVGGRLVLPVGAPDENQVLIRYEKLPSGQLSETDLCGCRFVPLVGSEG